MGPKRMSRFLSQRRLHVTFIALIAIFLSVLGTQLWFLIRLQQSSGATGRLMMRDFLIGVVTDVDSFYREAAGRLLDLSPETARKIDSTELKSRFHKRWQGAIKRFFILDLEAASNRQLRLF